MFICSCPREQSNLTLNPRDGINKEGLLQEIISYPLFVHVIRKDIYGGVPYHMRPEAECDTAPHHRYLPYYVEQTGDNEFII